MIFTKEMLAISIPFQEQSFVCLFYKVSAKYLLFEIRKMLKSIQKYIKNVV